MTTTPALDGITVLDFATVGPAARASRMLSDYGATVVKIGAMPAAGAVQIDPPFYAYSGGRDTKRVCVDLKDNGTKELLESILADEEDHVDWLEAQLAQIEQVGLENYLSEQIG